MKRRFLVVAGIMVAAAMCAVITATVAMFQSRSVDHVTAEQALARAKAPFDRVDPALALNGPEIIAVRQNPPASSDRPRALHLIVWQADRQRLSSITLPFWLLNLTTEPIAVNGIQLRAKDLERYGRTLLLDDTIDERTRVVAWTD